MGLSPDYRRAFDRGAGKGEGGDGGGAGVATLGIWFIWGMKSSILELSQREPRHIFAQVVEKQREICSENIAWNLVGIG
jgi:hypothetical protein